MRIWRQATIFITSKYFIKICGQSVLCIYVYIMNQVAIELGTLIDERFLSNQHMFDSFICESLSRLMEKQWRNQCADSVEYCCFFDVDLNLKKSSTWNQNVNLFLLSIQMRIDNKLKAKTLIKMFYRAFRLEIAKMAFLQSSGMSHAPLKTVEIKSESLEFPNCGVKQMGIWISIFICEHSTEEQRHCLCID